MLFRYFFFSLVCFAATSKIAAQTAPADNNTVFKFLLHAPNASITALGGTMMAVKADNASYLDQNPALANSRMNRSATVSYEFLYGGAQTNAASYAQTVDAWGLTVGATLRSINYGSIKGTDEFGNPTTTFSPSEIALGLHAAKQIGQRLTAGATLRYASSRFEQYQSSGLLMDLGGAYSDDERQTTFGIVVKNVGVALSNYTTLGQKVPTDIQVGFTQKLARAPLRLGIVAHDLLRWQLRYDDPNPSTNLLSLGDTPAPPSAFAQALDNTFRHLILSVEILGGKKQNFRLRAAYNHQRRAELSVANINSLAGFSFGVGFKVGRFFIDYGTATYHYSGGTNHFTISSNLSDWTSAGQK
jgi:hypothetical protein